MSLMRSEFELTPAKAVDMANSYSTLGNVALMKLPKVSFLSSRKISPEAVMGSHSWAAKIRDEGTCVIGGFQSDLEKDVLKFLLRGNGPVIIVEARKARLRVPSNLREAFEMGRLLFVSLPESKNARVGVADAERRNTFVLRHSETHVFGSVDPAGHLAKLVSQLPQETVTVLG